MRVETRIIKLIQGMMRANVVDPATGHWKSIPKTWVALINGDTLIDEILAMSKRASKKPGGLGRIALLIGACFVATASAQTLPDRFGAAGLGFQSTATPQTSGWASVCVRTTDRIYSCGATDYAGTSSSARAEFDTRIYSVGGLNVFAKAGAGAATGSDGGVGGSFTGGGVITFDVSKWLKVAGPGLNAVFSMTFTKNDVNEPAVVGTGLAAFGAKSVFRFGFGKAF